jgi:hypothetical protein
MKMRLVKNSIQLRTQQMLLVVCIVWIVSSERLERVVPGYVSHVSTLC